MASAGVVAVNTSIAAGVGGFTVLVLRAMIEKCGNHQTTYYDLSATANGVLAGLVSITAGCADVTDYGAFVIGFLGGGVYVVASYAVRKSGVDDPLDAFAIHGACGAWGVFALGLFHTTDGAFYGGDGTLLGWQVAGILAITVWSIGFAVLIFGILKAAKRLRVSAEEEKAGLDKKHHGGNAYAIARKKTGLEMAARGNSKNGVEADLEKGETNNDDHEPTDKSDVETEKPAAEE